MAQIPDIYQYTEYRTFLRDWFEASKLDSPHLSYRYLGLKTGVDAGYLVHVFQGAKHLSEVAVERFITLLKLDAKRKRYFAEMVRFNKAKREIEIQERFQKLTSLRENDSRVLSQSQYRYWSQWWVPAVRLTLLHMDVREDYSALAARITPAITAKQAKEAVELLLELGLVGRREDGVLEVKELHIYTGDTWTSAAIKEFQSTTLGLAQQSLRMHNQELREIATLTLAIPTDEIATLKEMMREFRTRVAKWALSHDSSQCVMQFNLACFPLSLDESKEST